MNVGDYIGGLYQKSNGDWYLLKSKITKITETKKYGRRYFTKDFYPMSAEEVSENTKELKELKGMMLTKEVVGLDNEMTVRLEKWVEWANQNKDRLSLWD